MRVVALVGLMALLTGCASGRGDTAPSGSAPAAPVPAAANKKLVVDFYRVVFIEKKVREGFERYVVPEYVQHNPLVPTGRDAAVKLLTPRVTKESITDIKRVIAEGDLVVLHVHSRSNAQDRGRAVVDIFRVADGKIIEHWDVIQVVPPTSANNNSMF
jgi:predicted SnoaL-like aldol condensation-catalyzing enzyme